MKFPTPRVRFAPSPTGYLHIGGLRTALFNHLFARATGGTFVLRIEDTDQTRLVPGSAANLIKMLRWSGITIDEGPDLLPTDVAGATTTTPTTPTTPTATTNYGPYVQSERLPLYKQHAQQLVQSGAAYPCFCSTARLKMLKKAQQKKASGPMMYDRRCHKLPQEEVQQRLDQNEPHTIRLFVPNKNNGGETKVSDLILGTSTYAHTVIDDQILMKSDGYPTYHLANVVDDHHMNITHVIRGEEWLPSTPKHQLLYEAFDWEVPYFAHLPLLLNSDRSKLSKRQGDVSVEDYVQKGYLPSGLNNFIALLGWNPGEGSTTEVFSTQSLIDSFSLERINKGGAVVDRNKLFWMNGEHIRLMADGSPTERQELKERALPFIQQYLKEHRDLSTTEGVALMASLDPTHVMDCLALLSQRAGTLEDFGSLCDYFWMEPSYANETTRQQMWDVRPPGLLEAARDALMEAGAEGEEEDVFATGSAMKSRMKQVLKEFDDGNYKMKQLFLPLRYAVSGTNVGADLMATMVLLGREKCIRRLNAVLEKTKV